MTLKNTKVLEFYKELPFNISGNLDLHEDQLRKFNPLKVYPELEKIISSYGKLKIIDFGCGAGWLVNSLSFHLGNKAEVTGVDFNPKAIEYAQNISNRMKLNSKFKLSDLSAYENNEKYDLLISLGVLHHTNDCLKAIEHICKYGNEKSNLFLGLYHKYGRKPFLDYFKEMKTKSEEHKFLMYKKIHKNIKDEKKLYSWFRDQVLHPHETQHTFEELIEVFKSSNYKIVATSINKFEKIDDPKKIISLEKKLYDVGKKKLEQSQYYPGFFITIGKKFQNQ